jgi:hypothetical protein
MNEKRFFAGLTAGLRSIGLVRAGCEGPTGADGSPGGGGAGQNGSIMLTQENVSDVDLAAAFAATGLAVVPGNVVLASTVETVFGEVPAGRKLIAVSADTLEIGEASTDRLVINGELELGEGVLFDASGDALGGSGGTIGSMGANGKVTLKKNSGIAVDSGSAALLTKVSTATGATGTYKAVGAAATSGGITAALAAPAPVTVLVKDLTIDSGVANAIAAGLLTGKTLVLSGTTTSISNALDLAGKGDLLVTGTAKLGAFTLTGDSTTANIFITGTLLLDETASLLAGKIEVDGTVELDSTAVPAGNIPATVTFNEGSVLDIAGTTMSGGKIAADLTLATLTDTTGGGTALFAGNAVIGTVDTDGNTITIDGTSLSTVDIGEVTGGGIVELGSDAVLDLTFSIFVEGTISGVIDNYGATDAARVANINKIMGVEETDDTVVVTDAWDMSGGDLTEAVTFTPDAIELQGAFTTMADIDVTFNGTVTFGNTVTLTGEETLTLLGEATLEPTVALDASAGGTVVVGDTSGDSVTFTGATLTAIADTSDSAGDGKITLDGEDGAVVFTPDASGSSDTGSLVLEAGGSVTITGEGNVDFGGILTLALADAEGAAGTFTNTPDGASETVTIQADSDTETSITGIGSSDEEVPVFTLGANAALALIGDANELTATDVTIDITLGAITLFDDSSELTLAANAASDTNNAATLTLAEGKEIASGATTSTNGSASGVSTVAGAGVNDITVAYSVQNAETGDGLSITGTAGGDDTENSADLQAGAALTAASGAITITGHADGSVLSASSKIAVSAGAGG